MQRKTEERMERQRENFLGCERHFKGTSVTSRWWGAGAQEPALPISRLLLRKGSKDDLRRSGWDAEDVARSRVVQSL